MAEDYITLCTACSKGLTRENLKYENGLAFHTECFEQHGNKFPPIDQLKNLKIRNNGSSDK